MPHRSPYVPILAAVSLCLAALACDLPNRPTPDLTQDAVFTANVVFLTHGAETAGAQTATAGAPPLATTPPASPDTPEVPSAEPLTIAPTGPPFVTPTPLPEVSATEPPPALPPEAILILSPGPGSRLTSPITVTGIADPTFENHLTVELGDDTTAIVDIQPATIQADAGQRGQFQVTLTFPDSAASENGRISILDLSARDGHVVHLASVPVALVAAGGQAEVQTAAEHGEEIAIQSPALGEVVVAGVVHVAGYAGPAFEQTLAVRLLDQSGNVVGVGTVTIQADAGQTGAFAGDIPYTVTEAQPGSVQVYTVSARDGAILHLGSVEVTLGP